MKMGKRRVRRARVAYVPVIKLIDGRWIRIQDFLKRLPFLVVLCAGLVSCGVPEMVKETNEQNLGAARKIREVSTEKPVQDIAADIEANSKALQDYLGKAERELAYSREESARLRHELEAARAGNWWGILLSAGLSLIGGGAGVTALVRLLPQIFGGPAAGIAESSMEALTMARQQADQHPDGMVKIEDVLAHLSQRQAARGVQGKAKTWVTQVEQRMKITPKRTLRPTA